jgi:hypothetical protein
MVFGVIGFEALDFGGEIAGFMHVFIGLNVFLVGRIVVARTCVGGGDVKGGGFESGGIEGGGVLRFGFLLVNVVCRAGGVLFVGETGGLFCFTEDKGH